MPADAKVSSFGRARAAIGELLIDLTQYFGFYKAERPHQALDNRTPEAVYRSGTGGGAFIIDKYPRAEPVSCTALRAACCERPSATTTLQIVRHHARNRTSHLISAPNFP